MTPEGSVAAGPGGTRGHRSTDAQMHADVLSWSRSRGLFAGVAHEGLTLRETWMTTPRCMVSDAGEPRDRDDRGAHPKGIYHADRSADPVHLQRRGRTGRGVPGMMSVRAGVVAAIVATGLLAPARAGGLFHCWPTKRTSMRCGTATIAPMLKVRFPEASREQILEARGYAYGGCVIQDLGYYPFRQPLLQQLAALRPHRRFHRWR